MALAAPFPAAGTRSTRPLTRTARPSTRPASPNPLRLTVRGRLALLVLSTCFLALVVLVSGRFTADAGTSAPLGPATSVVVVQPGESLWQIARQIAPSADPREVVTIIRELNGLGDTTVVAGQSVVVPAATRRAAP